MMREAESHADEDKKRREEIEARNKGDQAVYAAERMIKDSGDKLSASDRQAVEAAIEGLKKANESNDAAAIQRALDELTAAQHKAAETLYRQTQPGGGAAPGGASSAGESGPSAQGPKSDVIDAEVVDEGKQ